MTAPAPQPTRPPDSTGIARAQTPALVVGIVGAIACAIGVIVLDMTVGRAFVPAQA